MDVPAKGQGMSRGERAGRGHRAWRKHDVEGNQAINLPATFCYQFPGEGEASRGLGMKG